MDDVEISTIVEALKEPSEVGNTSPATAVSYLKCSLCNQIIEDESAHAEQEHGHIQHIKAMLRKPLVPVPVGSDKVDLHTIGAFAVSMSRRADRGAEAFQVMQRAQTQLQRLLDGVQNSQGCVYVFGSVVSMGCWDGVGDGDFSFVTQKSLHNPALSGHAVTAGGNEGEEGEKEEEEEEEEAGASNVPIVEDDASDSSTSGGGSEGAAAATHDTSAEQHCEGADDAVEDAAVTTTTGPVQLSGQALSHEREKRIICGVTARLRAAGFRFEELDPVLHTRIPVVRRKRPAYYPLNLRAMHQNHLILVRFVRESCEKEFRRSRLQTLISTYNAQEVPQNSRGQGSRQLILAVADSCDAVHLMSRRERIPGVRKEWLFGKRTPEIFSVDFDLSCRVHGIRNSWLLRRYMERDEVFRMGNVFLKKWSKACGINNSRFGFMTSYAISVLWVYFLLRRGEVAFVNPDDVPVLPDPEKQMEVPYIPLWPALDDHEADAARTTRLGALLRDFFYFYGQEFDWETQVVTIRQPCLSSADIRTKADLNWSIDYTLSAMLYQRCYHIFSIEDVYEDDLDLGRHLTEEKAAWTRLQFRLAYVRCGGEEKPLMRLLDVPRKRANDVLRARLNEYLLLEAENAESAVDDLFGCLCRDDEQFPGEDPAYLLGAYELGNRLSDLWYDKEQIKLDVANHTKYDRRANQYSPPEDPEESGKWALWCTDPPPTRTVDGHNGGISERRVRLEPPKAIKKHDGCDQLVAQSAPRRQREINFTAARNKHAEMLRLFAAQETTKDKQKAAMSRPSVVGLRTPQSDFPHCFYTLQTHRLFSSYDAREIFLQCLEDVACELTRLHEVEAEQLDDRTRTILTHRQRFFEYLKQQLCFTAMEPPGYGEVLYYVVVVSCDYVHFQLQQKVALLVPSPHLLGIFGYSALQTGASHPTQHKDTENMRNAGRFAGMSAAVAPRHFKKSSKAGERGTPGKHQHTKT